MLLVWSVDADRDLDEIVSYIAQDAPAAAVRIEDRIVDQVETLVHFPELRRPGRVMGTRELVIVHTPYIATYRIANDTIRILRILHGAQRWPDLLPY